VGCKYSLWKNLAWLRSKTQGAKIFGCIIHLEIFHLSLAIATEVVCCLQNGFYGQEGRKIILVRGRKRKATSTINRKRRRQTRTDREREMKKRQLK